MKQPTFSELPNEWTPVFPSSELRDKPVPFTLAGERLVFFRGASGASAVLEQCPHRGVSLALGQVVDGCLQCPFHGWRFGADGACTHVPFNPGVATERLGTQAIFVREAAGLVWAYTGAERPTTEPILPELASRPGARFGYLWEDWNTHWTRVMENMLDTPHLPFVHKATIGAGIARRMGPTTKMEQTLVETPDGFDIRYKLDADPSDAMLQWIRPLPKRRRTSPRTRPPSASAPGTTTPSCRGSSGSRASVPQSPAWRRRGRRAQVQFDAAHPRRGRGRARRRNGQVRGRLCTRRLPRGRKRR